MHYTLYSLYMGFHQLCKLFYIWLVKMKKCCGNLLQSTQRTDGWGMKIRILLMASKRYVPWTSYHIRKIAGCECAGNAHAPRVSNPDMHHGFLWSQSREKRSRHSRRMRSPQLNVSGNRPINLTKNRLAAEVRYSNPPHQVVVLVLKCQIFTITAEVKTCLLTASNPHQWR